MTKAEAACRVRAEAEQAYFDAKSRAKFVLGSEGFAKVAHGELIDEFGDGEAPYKWIPYVVEFSGKGRLMPDDIPRFIEWLTSLGEPVEKEKQPEPKLHDKCERCENQLRSHEMCHGMPRYSCGICLCYLCSECWVEEDRLCIDCAKIDKRCRRCEHLSRLKGTCKLSRTPKTKNTCVDVSGRSWKRPLK